MSLCVYFVKSYKVVCSIRFRNRFIKAMSHERPWFTVILEQLGTYQRPLAVLKSL